MPIDIKQLESSLRDSGALPYLISGGAGALVGGTAAAMTKRKRESKLARLGRILGTGLMTGAGVGGAHKLFDYSRETFNNALPAGDVSPEQEALTGGATRAIGGGLALAGTAGLQHKKDLKTWKQLSTVAPEQFGSSGASPGRNAAMGYHARKGTNTFRNIVNDVGATKGTAAGKDVSGLLTDLGISLKRPSVGGIFAKLGPKARLSSMIGSGHMINSGNKVLPLITKFTGRTKGQAALRLATLATGTMYPEIMSGMGKAKDAVFPGDEANTAPQ